MFNSGCSLVLLSKKMKAHPLFFGGHHIIIIIHSTRRFFFTPHPVTHFFLHFLSTSQKKTCINKRAQRSSSSSVFCCYCHPARISIRSNSLAVVVVSVLLRKSSEQQKPETVKSEATTQSQLTIYLPLLQSTAQSFFARRFPGLFKLLVFGSSTFSSCPVV